MNIEHFLTELKIHLRPLTDAQIALVLDYYQEFFSKEMAEGLSEQEVVASVGTPAFLAQQILKKYDAHIDQKNPTQSANGWQEIDDLNQRFDELHSMQQTRPQKPNFFQRFFQISGIVIINLFFMFWIFLTAAILLFSGWLLSITFIASPFIALIAGVSGLLVQPIFSLSITVLLFGLGLIGFLICRFLTKYFVKFSKYYLDINYQVLRG